MKRLGYKIWLFICFTGFIGLVATIDLIADPNRQPVKNIISIVLIALTNIGILKSNKTLMKAFPIAVLINFVFSAIKTNNTPGVIGSVLGTALIIFIWYRIYRTVTSSENKLGNI